MAGSPPRPQPIAAIPGRRCARGRRARAGAAADRAGPGAARARDRAGQLSAVPLPAPALEASPAAAAAVLDVVARAWRGLRIGLVDDGDPVAEALVAAARTRGWVVFDRVVGRAHVQDLTDSMWRCAPSLKQNRFHEKHLAADGAGVALPVGRRLARGVRPPRPGRASELGRRHARRQVPRRGVRTLLARRPADGGRPARGLLLRSRCGRRPLRHRERL